MFQTAPKQQSDMKEKDLQIIYALQKDPRIQNTELAEKLGMSEASVRRRIASMIKSKTVIPTAIPNTVKLGYNTRALIGLQVSVSKIDEVSKKLVEYKELQYVGICAGFTDIFVYGVFRSNEHLSRFIASELGGIDGIINIETMVELKWLKFTYSRLQPGALLPSGRLIEEDGSIRLSNTDRASKKFTKVEQAVSKSTRRKRGDSSSSNK